MALENLKSVFSEEAGVNNSKISGRYDTDVRVEPMESNFGERTSAVDFFTGENSYKPTLNPAVSGFTKFFNLGGYSFGEGQLGNSQYLRVNSDTQTTREINVDLSDLTTEQLGFGDFSSESAIGTFTEDTRFTAGIGFPFANTILQVSNQGNQASLFYTTTNGFLSVGASGAFSNFGAIGDIAQSIGAPLPPLDFDIDIFSPTIPRYTDTVFELENFTPFDNTEPLPAGALGNQRGIAFQTIFPNVNKSMLLEATAPNIEPISTISDLFLGPQKDELGRPSVSQVISSLNTGALHYYLDNQTSFVKLGALQYASIADAINAGDISYVKQQFYEFGEDATGIVIDKSFDIAQTIGSNLIDMANTFSIQVETPEFNLPNLPTIPNPLGFIGNVRLPNLLKLKGPTVDLPSFKSLGGFFGDLSIRDIPIPDFGFSSPFSFDMNFADTAIGQTLSNVASSVSDFGSSVSSFLGDSLGGVSSFLNDAGSSVIGFFESAPLPKVKISFNPDVQDLFNDLSNDTDELQNRLKQLTDSFTQTDPFFGSAAESGLLLRNQIISDVGGADGSFDINVNPRSLPSKPSNVIEPQAPYSELGNVKYDERFGATNSKLILEDDPITNLPIDKYSDGVVTNHTHDPDFIGPPTPEPASVFYPTTLHGGDKKSLLPIKEGNKLSEITETLGGETYAEIAEGAENGMPFYFRDMRTSPPTYVIFRGYLEGGITQEMAPNWTEHQYLGRSESVYTYANTKRTLSFTFKTYAQTKDEMHVIYEKLGYLAKMTYPEYQQDATNHLKNRMVPPYSSLRIGDLFGSERKNLQGFIDSLSYNWEDDSTWETKSGAIAPKKCIITVNYVVIHRQPPSRDMDELEMFGVHQIS